MQALAQEGYSVEKALGRWGQFTLRRVLVCERGSGGDQVSQEEGVSQHPFQRMQYNDLSVGHTVTHRHIYTPSVMDTQQNIPIKQPPIASFQLRRVGGRGGGGAPVHESSDSSYRNPLLQYTCQAWGTAPSVAVPWSCLWLTARGADETTRH